MPGMTYGTGFQRAWLANEPWEFLGQQRIYPIGQWPGQLAIEHQRLL